MTPVDSLDIVLPPLRRMLQIPQKLQCFQELLERHPTSLWQCSNSLAIPSGTSLAPHPQHSRSFKSSQSGLIRLQTYDCISSKRKLSGSTVSINHFGVTGASRIQPDFSHRNLCITGTKCFGIMT